MIKTISYWSMKDGLAGTHPINDALATAKREGYAAMELCIAPEGVLTINASQADCEAVRKEVDKSGIIAETLASGMSWGTNPASDDPAVRRKAIDSNKAALQRAAWLGCKCLLFVPGVVKSPISNALIRYDHAVNRAREAVKELLETAEKVGVDLLLENVWNGMFYSPLELMDFVDSFKSNRCGIYFDVGNLVGLHQHPPFWIEMLGKRIKRVHIKDFKESIGSLQGFCDLLAGSVPWADSMKALRGIGYDKTVVAEMMPWDPGLLSRTSVAMDKILAM